MSEKQVIKDGMAEVRIVLVEENPEQALLLKKNLDEWGITNSVVTLTDSKQALDFIFREGEYTNGAVTGLHVILLDLDLSGGDGKQVLRWIKSAIFTKHIPVIVHTSNSEEKQKCYDLGCDAFVVKPMEYTAFEEALQKAGLSLAPLQA